MNEVKLSDRFWTVPNMLSLFRIFLIFPILYFLRHPASWTPAFLLTAVAYCTDFLDGIIARVFHCQSRVGTILDPLGDKLLAVTLAAALYIRQEVPFVFFAVVASRDIIIAIGAVYAINLHRYVFLPLVVGKITTLGLGLFYCVVLFSKTPWGLEFGWLGRFIEIGVWVVICLLVFSGLAYIVNYIRHSFESKKEK